MTDLDKVSKENVNPIGIKIIGWLLIIISILYIPILLTVFYGFLLGHDAAKELTIFDNIKGLSFGLFTPFLGYSLLKFKKWSWYGILIYSLIGITGNIEFHIINIIAIIIFIFIINYFLKKDIKNIFLK